MILNYAVNSNHIHLIVVGGDGRDVIPNSIKLIAGRTDKEFNQRKKSQGSFLGGSLSRYSYPKWKHLFRCVVYNILNSIW